MGGIRKMVPLTYWMMFIGTIALTGVPLTAGFFSKDLILESAFAANTGLGEYAFYLGDLGAKALVVEAGYDGPALAAAADLGLGVLRLTPGEAAGVFTLDGPDLGEADPTPPGPDDVALILHTSGTTSRPKIVPLLHRNIAASAEHIRASLELGPEDRSLNVMPLFHIHGLVASLAMGVPEAMAAARAATLSSLPPVSRFMACLAVTCPISWPSTAASSASELRWASMPRVM